MRLFPHPFRITSRPTRSGVALVITIVMLAVITFLTVAFLALMGREKGAVKTNIDQTTARLAAETGLERAKAELLASIMATTNIASFDLLVSTNYIRYDGFDAAAQGTLNPETNVNFEYVVGGAPLSAQEVLQNLTNLLYSPRVPVYITNRLANTVDFRYYLDLNRNRRHDLTGLWPATNNLGGYFTTNGLLTTTFAPPNILSNYVTGDPEWIGIADRPDKRHGADNRFLARTAFIAIPEGKTLDINFMHNQTATRALGPDDGFFRNQGVGSWELNLAGFLADLNTNLWNPNPASPTYSYNQANPSAVVNPTGFGNVGVAFDDARSILTYRYANNYNTLAVGDPLFLNNYVDEYADGAWLITATNLPLDSDITINWAGSDNTNHYFSVQELFDPVKTSTPFVNRLNTAGAGLSTYDQYTYYRLLAQLGTASGAEDPDKLNLNYVNIGGLGVTNYLRWTNATLPTYFGGVSNSVVFFTNAVNRLLLKYTEEWLANDFNVYTNIFKTEQTFGVTNIPVYVRGQFVYSPAVHRILQMAANIWDVQAQRGDSFGELPTIFLPQFTTVGTNIYISHFREVSRVSDLPTTPILDITALPNPATTIQSLSGNALVFDVPLIVGARKGLPNFNEFSMESTFVLTRKLQVRKNATGNLTQTNQFFTMALTMPSGVEFWNSYASNFNRKVTIYATNRATMVLTNDLGVVTNANYITGGIITDPKLGTSYWPSYRENDTKRESFVVPLRTNVPFLPLTGYLADRLGNTGFVSATNTALFDTSQALLTPRWGMTITNRIHAMIVEQGTGRILDYVLLGNLTSYRNLTEEFSNPTTFGAGGGADAFDLLWATNTLSSGRLTGRKGIEQQINISRGANGGVDVIGSDRWRSYGNFNPNNVQSAVNGFNRFLDVSNRTNLVTEVPFSPSITYSMPMVWQANDPLVHYISGELFDIKQSGKFKKIEPPTLFVNTNALDNIGRKNTRYNPWPIQAQPVTDLGDADALAKIDPSLKDPLITRSDDWQFPTNALPTVGWLGRIHRGTPWQTVYLKASNIGLTNIVNTPTEWVKNELYTPAAERWANWTGNKTLEEGYYTRPVMDRLLFDVFTTSLNDNSARGRLSINQTNLAAWSAVFTGVGVLTNASAEPALGLGLPPVFNPLLVPPAGIYDPLDATTWPPLVRMVNGINAIRANTNFFPNGTFRSLGDVLAAPELTDASPFLNRATQFAPIRGLTDVAYEWLPQQTMSLLQLGEPRFVIYAYGQSLQPAPESVVTSGGAFFGLCTNYAPTAEVALRAVVRVEGSPNPAHTNTFLPLTKRYPPRIVVESFNYLAPD